MKHASKLAFAAIAAAVAAFSARAEDTIDITEDWQISAVKAAGNADKSKPLPEGGEWKPGKLTGKIPLANGAKGGNSFEGDYNAWYRKTVDVPADWKGSSVRYEQQLNWCSAVIPQVRRLERNKNLCHEQGIWNWREGRCVSRTRRLGARLRG